MSAAHRKVSLAQVLKHVSVPSEPPASGAGEVLDEPGAIDPPASSQQDDPQPPVLASAPWPASAEAPQVESAVADVPRRRGRPRAACRVSEQEILVLWMPTALHARLKASAASRGVRMLDVVLDAVEALDDEQLVEVVRRSQPAPRRTGRFERAASRASSSSDVPRTQATLRGALPSQLEVLDELVAATGARSRSAFLVAVLDHELPARPRSLR